MGAFWEWVGKEFLAAVVICLTVALVAVLVSGQPYTQQQPPQRSQDAGGQHSSPGPSSQPALPLQIECDPNCTAKPAQQGQQHSRISRFVEKTFDDPLALFTAILALATAVLAFMVLLQVKDGRKANRTLERAYLWPGFGEIEKMAGGGYTFPITVHNTGRTAAVLLEVNWALVSPDVFDAKDTLPITYTRFIDRENVIPPEMGGVVLRTGAEPPPVTTTPMVCCGWIVYLDVFDTRHEQSWKHTLTPAGKSHPIPGCYHDPRP